MQLDRARIAIRVRSHADVLDLAVVVLRHDWPGLAASALAGTAPVLAFNLFATDVFVESWFLYFLIVLVQIPWATAFVTLYLGQKTFAERVSLVKMGRDFLGSLASMVAYQGILRGACCLFVVLIPYAVLRMKFMSEIILLERAGFRQTSERAARFHTGRSGRLFAESLFDLGMGAVIAAVLTIAVGELYELLSGQLLDADLVVGWPAQLSLWLVLDFFAVARFLSYLDYRIRREGWDLELRLRAIGHRLAREVGE